MIYEFECPHGHVVEAMVPVGTKTWPCDACIELAKIGALEPEQVYLATRILSATKTTFVFADTGKRIKHIKKTAKTVNEIKRG